MILRPALFKPDMVNAIIEKWKTMTRRLNGLDEINEDPDNYENDGKCLVLDKKERLQFFLFNKIEFKRQLVSCPYGQEGDTLWVREGCLFLPSHPKPGWIYKADKENDSILHELKEKGYKWRPGIHMPFTAARIFLKITDIRLERLQQISQEDAKAEGIHREWDNTAYWYKNYLAEECLGGGPHLFKQNAVASFRSLWNKINGAAGYPWDKNPWVWCISFEVISTTGNPDPAIYRIVKKQVLQ